MLPVPMQWFVVDGKMPNCETVWLDLLGKKKLYLTAVAIKCLNDNQHASLVFLLTGMYFPRKTAKCYPKIP